VRQLLLEQQRVAPVEPCFGRQIPSIMPQTPVYNVLR
jgi:hypothetical protein